MNKSYWRKKKEGVEIQIAQGSTPKKPSKSKDQLKRERNLRKNIHQCHLLSLVAVAYHLNKKLASESEILAALILSTLPHSFNVLNLELLVKNYHDQLYYDDMQISESDYQASFESLLVAYFSNTDHNNNPLNNQVFIVALIALLRCLGYKARLVSSLHPVPFSPDAGKRRKSQPGTPVLSNQYMDLFPIKYWCEVFEKGDWYAFG